ncbi:nitrate reductase [Macromonas nakdongensis]|uniref:nitrate reductase n=1 Tax=Macromonas nakdongensis TaxID=1843082 RepID=UPI001E657B02|nr:nitrate reductase [Macromonas nakdongensis]
MTAAPTALARETRSTCPYCGVGCGVIIESVGEHITHVRGDPQHPANFGRLCTKGSTLHLTATPAIAQQVRLLQPMRRLQRGAAPEPLGWNTALDLAADRLATTVREHGPDAVGFYVSGQLLTEDYYVFNKLAKGLLGSNNIDTNSRLCMSSAVAGYKLTLGADAPPACYDDVNHADCLFIVGSNAAWAHPVLFRRIEDAKAQRPGMKVIVADPRRTDTASLADLYLPLQPGTDVMLFHGLLHILLAKGWVDADYIERHTTGFAALRELVQAHTPEVVAQVCGLPVADLFTAARWFAGVPDADTPSAGAIAASQRLRTLSLYCQGLNQSSNGTAKNASLINLHLATGQIGRAGAGPFSLTGQPNAMGGREVGGLANLLSAHRDLANPTHRAEVAALWGLNPGLDLPATPGKTAIELFQATADGEVKALWIACTNPAQSLPDQATVRRALERAEFVVVQDAYASAATCDWADLLLPATTWGEKDGTVTNSERRISRVRPAVAPPSVNADGPRHDWQIAVDLARRLEARLPSRAPRPLFPYETPEQVWNEHRESTRGRDLDITGLTYAQLEQAPQHWPYPTSASQATERLYTDGQFPTPDGKARFAALPYRPVAEERESRYPYALTTGRLRDQWHGMTRTGAVGSLFGHASEPEVALHPDDLAELGLQAGDWVRLTSKRGQVVLPAQPSTDVARRQAFVAMHWGSEYLGGRDAQGRPLSGINGLTTSAHCPTSKQPELKHAAVRIEAARLPWALCAMAWLPADQALRTQQALRPWLQRFDHAVCVPIADAQTPRDGAPPRVGLWFQAGAAQAPSPGEWAAVAQALGLDGPGLLRYEDPPRHQHRRVRWADDGSGRLKGFLLAGDTRSRLWLADVLRGGGVPPVTGLELLVPSATPPGGAPNPRNKPVCNCLGVGERDIVEVLADTPGAPAERLATLQGRLRCGTQCGSCVPELKRLVQHTPCAARTADTDSTPAPVLGGICS